MANTKTSELNRPYLLVVLSLTLFLPGISVFVDYLLHSSQPVTIALIGKWFIFYAVGIRLFTAGLRQITKPAFTAKEIFHITDTSSYPIVRELGFANVCFGLIGIISLFLPHWRLVSAFGSGLYYGIAAVNHLIKKPAGSNEVIALVSDIFVFLMLLMYVLFMCWPGL